MDKGILKFLYQLNRVVLFSSFVFFACLILFNLAFWDKKELVNSGWMLFRVLVLMIISYLIHIRLSSKVSK